MAGICKLILATSGKPRVVELPRGNASLRIGNTARCGLRVGEGLEGPVEVHLTSRDGIWTLEQIDNAYVTRDGVRCALPRKLRLRDELEVRLSDTEQTAFRMELTLDLESAIPKYDRIIDIHDMDTLVVGGVKTANLYIKDGMLGQDHFTLSSRGRSLVLEDNGSRWGVFVNGVRVEGEKTVNNTDFISLMGYSFYYKNGCLYTDSRDNIGLQGLHSVLSGVRSIVSEYPKFVRNVRKKIVLSEEEITVLDPPQKQQKPKNNIFLQLLPAVGSVLLVVFLRGAMGGGGSYIAFSACSMGLGALTTVISFIAGNRDYKKETATREKEYRDYIERKQTEIEKAREQEAAQLAQIYCDPQAELQRVWDFSGDLFDRQESDEDFLQIFLGKGEKPAVRPVKITEKESITVDDELFKIPRQLLEKYRCIPDAPIYLHTKDDNAIGVVGDRERLREMLKLMSLDLASRHYYTDLKLVYLVGPSGMEQFPWIRWLPHVKNDALGIRSIVCDEESKNAMFEFLYVELSTREQKKCSCPRYVVFVLDDYGLKSHPISKYIGRAKDLGFTFIFMESREELLPQECDEVVTLERASDRGTVYRTDNLNDVQRFTCHPIRDREMWDVAVTLSPVYSEEVSLESALTKSLTFFEMLGISSPADIDLQQNWSSAAVERSLAAPLGVKSKDEIVYLDLHEKAHGPHGLVAGTTGSGKSELLQSYILSMAVRYHPYEVGFVIIDFKGGGMANQFRNLPHLVGAITNIDGKEIDRSLKSIKAELQKRQRLFAEADVNKIDDYIKLYKRHQVATPLPHLIIVVDEFAELRAQQPEFMKELISAARIGRSLGVHLILATQKPSGQVDDQIWSNSRFKLCLKVATSQDSNEMIRSPLAAEIREPGRAYLMLGENESLELFQSAYSGGPATVESNDEKEFVICEVMPSGIRVPVFSRKRKHTESQKTQLDMIVEYIADYSRNAGIEKLPDICLPSLPQLLPYHSSAKQGGTGVVADIGIYDNPDEQCQETYSLDFESNNTMIIGSSQTGKTGLLQTIIRSLSENYAPSDIVFYIIDFASMSLKNFEELNHVGGVVCQSEDEKIKNLFKLLHSEMNARKEKLMSLGVSSFSAYKEAGKHDLPLIVVVIDNLTALKELYFQEDDDELITFCRDGLSLGISFLIANAQTTGIGYKYLSNFAARIALFCNDSGEYSALFDNCSERVLNVPGRCLVEHDHSILECQAFLAFEGEKEIQRVQQIKNHIAHIKAKYGNSMATQIPSVPQVVTFEQAKMLLRVQTGEKFSVVAGIDYETVEPSVINLASLGALSIVGRGHIGKHNWARYLMQMLKSAYPEKSEIYIVDSIDKRFAVQRDMENVYGYSFLAENAIEYVKQIEQKLKMRYDAIMGGKEEILEDSKLLVLIIDNPDAVASISTDVTALNAFRNIIGRYKNMRACVLLYVDNSVIPYTAPEILKDVRDKYPMLFFDDLRNMKIRDVPLQTAREFKKTIENGDCYYIRDNDYMKLRTPLCNR